MATATLTKVGNSMAVLLPKALRQEADIDQETPLRIASPRKGVVVITVAPPRGRRSPRSAETGRGAHCGAAKKDKTLA